MYINTAVSTTLDVRFNGLGWLRIDPVEGSIPSGYTSKEITFTSGGAIALSATKATQDESGNNIKATYGSSLSLSGKTVSLKNKNGETLGYSVTIPSTKWFSGTAVTSTGGDATVVS